MKAYISAATAISPQDTYTEKLLDGSIRNAETARLKCVEPDYKETINPGLIRRMSHIVKMGVAAAVKTLKDAGIENPDAIITGTGLGCMEDTGTFLASIFNNKEQFLTPTAFIQSTHNTIAGQIALMLKCNQYNFAYVHRGFSFENALLDAMMMIENKEATHILLGGIDEITDDYWNITQRLGMWKQGWTGADELFKSNTRGTLGGEGASFFLLSESARGALAQFDGVEMMFRPESEEFMIKRIHEFLDKNGLGIDDIDLVMLGKNGWPRYDRLYRPIEQDLFPHKPLLAFKHLCGEYMTASSFAAWLSAKILQKGAIPPSCLIRGSAPHSIKHILVYNHFLGTEHSMMLLSVC